jgi:hypothetical protein
MLAIDCYVVDGAQFAWLKRLMKRTKILVGRRVRGRGEIVRYIAIHWVNMMILSLVYVYNDFTRV